MRLRGATKLFNCQLSEMHLVVENISKSFPGVQALKAVDFDVIGGEIHALCGENGAGKSTLMHILGGNVNADEGKILLDGVKTSIDSPRKAFHLGISTVHQHLSLVELLTVAENIYANSPPVDKWGFIRYRELFHRTRKLLVSLGLENIDPRTVVSTLSPPEKQMIEIAKAMARDPAVLILDEPTASLTDRETTKLFSLLNSLRLKKIAIIYISHRLNEIFLLADRITVLKDGTSQGTFPKDNLSREELIRKMVGRDIRQAKTESSATTGIAMGVRGLEGKNFRDITFELHKGEILGMAGLVGAGRSEIARAIFAADKATSGEVRIGNVRLDLRHPADAVANGIAYVPEERKNLGIFPELSVEKNIIVAAPKKTNKYGLFNATTSRLVCNSLSAKLRISTPDIDTNVGRLSGGNQQKVLLARWLLTDPDILIVDEPTHGIDVGAKFQIYTILQALAAAGKGILMISSELPELLGICDRILVVKNGAIAGNVSRSEASEEKIIALAAN